MTQDRTSEIPPLEATLQQEYDKYVATLTKLGFSLKGTYLSQNPALPDKSNLYVLHDADERSLYVRVCLPDASETNRGYVKIVFDPRTRNNARMNQKNQLVGALFWYVLRTNGYTYCNTRLDGTNRFKEPWLSSIDRSPPLTFLGRNSTDELIKNITYIAETFKRISEYASQHFLEITGAPRPQ